nr:hypothetical protein [Bacilli bacterium]
MKKRVFGSILILSILVPGVAFASGGVTYQQFFAGQALITANMGIYTWQPTPGATLDTTSSIPVARIMSTISYRNTDGTYGAQSTQSSNSTNSGTAGITDSENHPGATTFNGYSYGGSNYYNY